ASMMEANEAVVQNLREQVSGLEADLVAAKRSVDGIAQQADLSTQEAARLEVEREHALSSLAAKKSSAEESISVIKQQRDDGLLRLDEADVVIADLNEQLESLQAQATG
ncbi:hypothetical protein THAOC_27546, partial [Thalassiosira oceanica]